MPHRDPERPLTRKELLDMFGTTRPPLIMDILQSDKSRLMTVGQLRAEVRRIGAALRTDSEAMAVRRIKAYMGRVDYVTGLTTMANREGMTKKDRGYLLDAASNLDGLRAALMAIGAIGSERVADIAQEALEE